MTEWGMCGSIAVNNVLLSVGVKFLGIKKMEETQGCKMCTEAKGRREEGRDGIRRRREGGREKRREGPKERVGGWKRERGGREREREREREECGKLWAIRMSQYILSTD